MGRYLPGKHNRILKNLKLKTLEARWQLLIVDVRRTTNFVSLLSATDAFRTKVKQSWLAWCRCGSDRRRSVLYLGNSLIFGPCPFESRMVTMPRISSRS